MKALAMNLLLALAWVVLTRQFSAANFALGFAIGFGALWLAERILEPSLYFKKVIEAIGFVIFFVIEVIKANLQVAYIVVNPWYPLRPGIVAIPLDARTDAEITLLANLITLTPGTLSIDVSADRKVLYIHVVELGEQPDQIRHKIKERLERRLLEVMR
jgi:multicomponent Na+:H+ antiporter subunit E